MGLLSKSKSEQPSEQSNSGDGTQPTDEKKMGWYQRWQEKKKGQPISDEELQKHLGMDRSQLKAAYKTQLRQAHSDAALATGAGLGLIDIARKAAEPVSCALQPLAGDNRLFFSLRVVIA